MDFNTWLGDVNGQTIGDGQCVALAEDYISRVCAMPAVSTDGGNHPGYASSMYANGPAAGFGQLPSSANGMPGYLAVWDYGYPFTPFSHVAVVIQDDGVTLKCMSQNPGPAHVMDIPKLGLLGYLTPGGGGSGATIQTAASVSTSGDIVSQFQNLVTAAQWLNNAQHWKRIGIFAIGAVLLVIALLKFLDDKGAIQWIAKTAHSTVK